MASMGEYLNDGKKLLGGILMLGLTGILFLIIFGNLSGNLGFSAGSQGANDTNAVINNLTGGAVTYFGFSNTWFTLGAVVLLIAIVLSVIRMVNKEADGGFSN